MDELQRIVAAGQRGVRVAVAESLTCGLLCSAIGKGTDASTWLAGGVVAYLLATKEHVLGLAPGTDPCSAACAVQLAAGVRSLLDADAAVSTTGVGGPEPECGHAPGTVYLGWATATGSGYRELQLPGPPEQVLAATVRAGVELLAEIVTLAEVTVSAQKAAGTPSATTHQG